MNLEITRTDKFRGTVRPPSDKSLTHRALMLAAIVQGVSTVRMPLMADDPRATMRCLGQLGLAWDWIDRDVIRLYPPDTWRQPTEPLDCGNSGTTMRLLSGLLAGRRLNVTLTGDASLSRRPMERIAVPLRQMGATVEGTHAPLHIIGSAPLKAVDYVSSIASAQVKSCVLLAGLRANGTTCVTEPSVSRDHTERMLAGLGVNVASGLVRDSKYRACVEPPDQLDGFDFLVPGDISSAAFLMVAAALVPGGDSEFLEVGVNPTRDGIFDVFDQAGIYYEVIEGPPQLGEPVATVLLRQFSVHGERTAFLIGGPLVPRLIDEIPVLAVLATQLHGTSTIRDAQELRSKETDRIEKVADGLNRMGACVETFEDGMAITGPTPLHGARIDCQGDHRIGMAFAVAGLIADGVTTIEGAETIATSYPDFESDLRRLCNGA